jgi:hypothetical protein
MSRRRSPFARRRFCGERDIAVIEVIENIPSTSFSQKLLTECVEERGRDLSLERATKPNPTSTAALNVSERLCAGCYKGERGLA